MRKNIVDFITEPERQVPVTHDVDVLICGGGFAGVAAAIAAARNGASVMLIEKYGFLGGLATAALVITTPPLNNGINREIAKRLMSWGSYAPNPTWEDAADSGNVDGIEGLKPYDPETTKFEFVRMLLDQKVEILFHTYIVDAVSSNGRIQAVLVENKAGRSAIRAKMFVDATGDADIAFFAGAPVRDVERPITMMFNMADVDTKKALENLGNWNVLKKVVRKAVENGELKFSQKTDPDFGAPGIFAANLIHKGQIGVWGGMLYSNRILDPKEKTRAEIVTRNEAFLLARYLNKNVPGFENARLEQMSTEVGIRATRNLIGLYVPSKLEVTQGVFPDTVVRPYRNKSLALPYRSLLPQRIGNLIVAGRCISADDAIMGRLRLIPVCSATGEAAGVAASLAVKQGVDAPSVDVSEVQLILKDNGVEL
jgi:hypothetical protein